MFDILLKIFTTVTLLAMPYMFLATTRTKVNPEEDFGNEYNTHKNGKIINYTIAIIGQILAIMFVLELWSLVDFF